MGGWKTGIHFSWTIWPFFTKLGMNITSLDATPPHFQFRQSVSTWWVWLCEAGTPLVSLFFCGAVAQCGSWPHSWRFKSPTMKHVSRTPLDEWSAHHRELYLTTHNTHNSQTSLPPAEFEPTISAGEQPQTYTLDHMATGTSVTWIRTLK